MNRPLFGPVLARRLFGEPSDDNGSAHPPAIRDGVGGTGAARDTGAGAGLTGRAPTRVS